MSDVTTVLVNGPETTVVEVVDDEVTTVLPGDPETVVIATGEIGPAGPAGTSFNVVTMTAGTDLSGHRVVVLQDNETVGYADANELVDVYASMWMTLDAALALETVKVCTYGIVEEPSWNWTMGLPIYLGANGQLTQVVPTLSTSEFLVQVATPVSPTSLFWNPRIPIVLS